MAVKYVNHTTGREGMNDKDTSVALKVFFEGCRRGLRVEGLRDRDMTVVPRGAF